MCPWFLICMYVTVLPRERTATSHDSSSSPRFLALPCSPRRHCTHITLTYEVRETKALGEGGEYVA